jgi:hypothetical protein
MSPFSPSPAGRVYDRLIPAPLPLHRMLNRPLPPGFPFVIDTRPNCGPRKDQGDEGACTGHAGTEAGEWEHRRYLKKSPIFSPQYTYAKELIRQGDFPNDCGSDGTTLCTTLVADGCCELSLYPYVSGKIIMPTPAQDVNAHQFALGAFHGLVGSQTALSVLADPTPWPVMIGFTVYASFESNEVAKTGVMPMPGRRERNLGGHEVLMVGYDIGDIPTLRPKGSLPSVLIMNSWGNDWGIDGFFWMPIQVLDMADTDLKIAHLGHPWVAKAA